ncbi:hypothetical protein [Pseudomonas sp. MH9.3]|uniref:hypothetical protein n=1 Tax=Pseudomonas sp. MH9.3 TaxID=3048630 RepID=UPI003A10239F
MLAQPGDLGRGELHGVGNAVHAGQRIFNDPPTIFGSLGRTTCELEGLICVFGHVMAIAVAVLIANCSRRMMLRPSVVARINDRIAAYALPRHELTARLFTVISIEYTIESIKELQRHKNFQISKSWEMSYDPVRCAIFASTKANRAPGSHGNSGLVPLFSFLKST